jgi:3-hydroxyacyl-CoA dehydrogenase
MTTPTPVQRIAIVGTGTIGASWATTISPGLDVTATIRRRAPRPLRSYVQGAWEG